MRVLHLISSGGYYGAENMLINLARGLEKLNCSNVIGIFNNSSNPHLEIADHARKELLAVVLIPCKGRLDFAAIRFLRRYVQDQHIDVVHVHGYKASLYGWLAARCRQVSLVATCHNWTRATVSLRLYALLDLYILKRFHKVVGVSMDVVEKLRDAGISNERVLMIPNGVEISNHDQRQPEPFQDHEGARETVVGSVGRIVPQKGFQYLLQAIPGLLDKFPQTKFLFVGEGSFRKELEDLAQRLGIQSHVIFAGKQENMKSIYDSIDIFVLPSLNEGMPMTILEAMAAAKPVVATSVGAIPTLVVPGETGLLVQPRDSVGLQNALARLLGDPCLRNALGKRGRIRIAESYSLQTMAQKYSALYAEEIQNRMPCR